MSKYIKGFFVTKGKNKVNNIKTNQNKPKIVKNKQKTTNKQQKNTVKKSYNDNELCYQDGRIGMGNCNKEEKIVENIDLPKSSNIKYNPINPKTVKDNYKRTEIKPNKPAKTPKTNPSGFCYRPKFIYLDNSAKGILNLQGYAPAIYNDVMNITPDKLFPILAGYSVGGGGVIPCEKEEFTNFIKKSSDIKNKTTYSLIKTTIIILFIILLLCFIIFKKN
jgi:hypothetical protein